MAKATAAPRGRGRPTKEEAAIREAARLKIENEVAKTVGQDVKTVCAKAAPIYKCTHCGTTHADPKGRFYMVSRNDAFNGNEGYTNICYTCANQYFNDYKQRFGDEKLALMLVCTQVGHYFSEPLYDKMIEDGEEFTLGNYFRALNGAQYKGKSFITYMMELYRDNKTFQPTEEKREEQEEAWRVADQKNKRLCLNAYGGDPFDDDCYSTADRRFLFTQLASYLTDEVMEDKHRLNSLVSMVKAALQVAYLDRKLNQLLRGPGVTPDEVKKVGEAKNALQTTINKIAEQCGLTAGARGAGKGKNSTGLTAIMKEMLDNGIIEAKVNHVTVKMDEAYRAIAKTSHRALLEELHFTGDEYAAMVAEQSDTIVDLRERLMETEENLRLARVELERLTSPKPTHRPVEVEITPSLDALKRGDA